MRRARNVTFTQAQLASIADALGHTEDGLMDSEIDHLLATCKIKDVNPDLSTRYRVFYALAHDQYTHGNRNGCLAFIRHAMRTERFVLAPRRFEPLRMRLNQAMRLAGVTVLESGALDRAEALPSEATRRAQKLRASLTRRGVHADVLKCCREELLADGYFNAVQEAVKGVADKLRTRTGLTYNGIRLVDDALTGTPPILALNSLETEDEQHEQRGFANLVRGAFGMFRNATAHAARIHWPMTKSDAEDLLSLVSLLHRRVDAGHVRRRA